MQFALHRRFRALNEDLVARVGAALSGQVTAFLADLSRVTISFMDQLNPSAVLKVVFSLESTCPLMTFADGGWHRAGHTGRKLDS